MHIGVGMCATNYAIFGVAGDPKLVDMYQDAEVTRVMLRLPSEGRDTILPLLDQDARFLQ